MKKENVLKKYRNMSNIELNSEMNIISANIFRAKIKNKVGQLTNTNSIRIMRAEIARINTIKCELSI